MVGRPPGLWLAHRAECDCRSAVFGRRAPASVTINDFKDMDGDKAAGYQHHPGDVRAVGRYLAGDTDDEHRATIRDDDLRGLGALAEVFLIIAGLFVAQLPFQRRLVRDPLRQCELYNASGTTLFVWGMLAAAIGVR